MAWNRNSGGYGGWAPYVSVDRKIAQGKVAAKTLAKKEGREPSPVNIEGRKIAKTFWGLKWCENLERYRDFANRLPRGATYARNGSIVDLVIESGQIRAIVGGSEPYRIVIKIKTLSPNVWKQIGHDCAQEIDSLFDLLRGEFSNGVMQRLTQADGGLFPHSSEISMSCSCPDYAGVCKHIAATFYGVAARLDTQPELLFKLRNVDHLELIGHATNAASLDQALGVDGQTLVDGDLENIFGIELETSKPRPKRKSKPSATAAPRKRKAAQATEPVVIAKPKTKLKSKPKSEPAAVTATRTAKSKSTPLKTATRVAKPQSTKVQPTMAQSGKVQSAKVQPVKAQATKVQSAKSRVKAPAKATATATAVAPAASQTADKRASKSSSGKVTASKAKSVPRRAAPNKPK